MAYVEALTRPEMRLLGYAPVTDTSLEHALGAFRPEDDPGRRHPAFEPDLSTDPRELTLERDRFAHLVSTDPVPDEASWFVLPNVREQLAAALAEHTESRAASTWGTHS